MCTAQMNGVPLVPALIGSLSFDTSGVLSTTIPMPLSANVPATAVGATAPSPLHRLYRYHPIRRNFSVNTLNQDGYTSGGWPVLTWLPTASFWGANTNGQTAVLGQVVLAGFANPNGLQPQGQ